MTLLEYISDSSRRAKLAADCGRSPDYLWQVATNRRRASTELAQLIDRHTAGEVQKGTLRPDVWELLEDAAAPAKAA